ncbi:hypothetical protein KQI65_10985 [bacterium]|nr:hypothetical protein [bacterium]
METSTIWTTVTTFITVACIAGALYFVYAMRLRGMRPGEIDENGERTRLPLTVFQVRAAWGLGIGTVALLAILRIFLDRGAENYYLQDDMRNTVYLIAMCAAAAYLTVHVVTALRNRGRVKDERDIAVLHWAPTVQVLGMTLTLAFWAIGLTETYWASGQVPIAYPILIFLSTLIVGGLFQAAGVLIGYWRF